MCCISINLKFLPSLRNQDLKSVGYHLYQHPSRCLWAGRTTDHRYPSVGEMAARVGGGRKSAYLQTAEGNQWDSMIGKGMYWAKLLTVNPPCCGLNMAPFGARKGQQAVGWAPLVCSHLYSAHPNSVQVVPSATQTAVPRTNTRVPSQAIGNSFPGESLNVPCEHSNVMGNFYGNPDLGSFNINNNHNNKNSPCKNVQLQSIPLSEPSWLCLNN